MKKRLLCPVLPTPGSPVSLPKEEAHHAIHVLRLKEGDTLEALDGKGGKTDVILKMKEGPIRLELENPFQYEPKMTPLLGKNNPISITLEMALIKTGAMEWIIEKAVELNIHRFIPIRTARSIVQINKKGPEFFQKRWQKIADQALKQCGRPYKMPISLPIPFKSQVINPITEEKKSLRLWCDEKKVNTPLFLLEWLQTKAFLKYQEIKILIGPEGGWSHEERIQLLKKSEHSPIKILRINLGSSTLRAETAALYAVSLLSAHIELKNFTTI